MATLQIRDPYGNTFEIDATARAFWERREGYTILPDEPATPPAESRDEPQREDADTPRTTTKRAARAAQDVKEQPDG